MREETFGPTLPVVKVADEDEAIRLANDSRYGLSASVWTSDPARGERVARRIEAGAVNINDALANGFQFGLPMPGWKDSGIGSRNGAIGAGPLLARSLLIYGSAASSRHSSASSLSIWLWKPPDLSRSGDENYLHRFAGYDRHNGFDRAESIPP